MQKITPFLWFNDNAEEAVNFYVSVFKNAKVEDVSRYGEGGPGPAGTVMVATFQLEGETFMAMNGGPAFSFNPAISLMVDCETQEEVDTLWDRLVADGGQELECGWLTDKFGLSWQITPRILSEMIRDQNPEKANRVMQAMLQMKKIDIAALKRAREEA